MNWILFFINLFLLNESHVDAKDCQYTYSYFYCDNNKCKYVEDFYYFCDGSIYCCDNGRCCDLLSAGPIAGIATGCIVAGAIIIFIIVKCRAHRGQSHQNNMECNPSPTTTQTRQVSATKTSNENETPQSTSCQEQNIPRTQNFLRPITPPTIAHQQPLTRPSTSFERPRTPPPPYSEIDMYILPAYDSRE